MRFATACCFFSENVWSEKEREERGEKAVVVNVLFQVWKFKKCIIRTVSYVYRYQTKRMVGITWEVAGFKISSDKILFIQRGVIFESRDCVIQNVVRTVGYCTILSIGRV